MAATLSFISLMWAVCVIYLLQANGVGLGLTVLTQVELLVKLLGQVAMTALSEQCDFSMELHSSLKNILKQEKATGQDTNIYFMAEKQLEGNNHWTAFYVEDNNIWINVYTSNTNLCSCFFTFISFQKGLMHPSYSHEWCWPVFAQYLWWAILGNADIIGGNSLYTSIFMEQNLDKGNTDKRLTIGEGAVNMFH